MSNIIDSAKLSKQIKDLERKKFFKEKLIEIYLWDIEEAKIELNKLKRERKNENFN